MASGVRLSQRIANRKKQRNSNPQRIAKTMALVSTATMKRLADENLDVLITIEGTCLRCSAEDSRIDDAVIWNVLRGLLIDEPPSTLPNAWLYSEIMSTHNQARCIEEQVWNDCLLVVKDSVELHSTHRPGDRFYLDFLCATMAR